MAIILKLKMLPIKLSSNVQNHVALYKSLKTD